MYNDTTDIFYNSILEWNKVIRYGLPRIFPQYTNLKLGEIHFNYLFGHALEVWHTMIRPETIMQPIIQDYGLN